MPVILLAAGSRVHVLVMDYAGHARGGMPVMLTGHAVMLAGVCQSRTMPVMLAHTVGSPLANGPVLSQWPPDANLSVPPPTRAE